MKRLILASTILAIGACSQPTTAEKGNPSKEKQITIIKGKVAKEVLTDDAKSIFLYESESHIVSRDLNEASIDSTGAFTLLYEKDFNQLAFFRVGGVTAGLYLEPGKNMEVSIEKDTVLFSGDLSEVNREFNKYRKQFGVNPYFKLLGPSAKEKGTKQFIEDMQAIEDSLVRDMDSLKRAGEIGDKTYELLSSTAKSSNLNLVIQMGAKGPFSYPEIAKHVFDLAQNYSGSLDSQDLKGELSIAYVYLEESALAVDTTAEYIELVDTVVGMIESSFSKEMAEVVYQGYFNAWLRRNKWEEAKVIGPYVSKYIRDAAAREKLTEKVKEIEARSKKPEDHSAELLAKLYGDPELSAVAKKIFEDNKGKVVYLDICGQHCGGCMMEFPRVKEMEEKVGYTDQIEYVYLVTDASPKEFDAAVKKRIGHTLNGQKYYLTKDQAQRLYRTINSWTIPRYMMVNKKGVIVDAYASRPSNAATVNTLLDLIKE